MEKYKDLPDKNLTHLSNDSFQTNHQTLNIELLGLPLTNDFTEKWWAEQKKKTGGVPGQLILKIGEDFTTQTSSTSRQVPQISGIIVPPMPDLEKQTSTTGSSSLPDILGDRVKGERRYPQLQDSLSSFKPEDRPKVGRLLEQTLKHVQLEVQENILHSLPNIPDEVRTVVSDAINRYISQDVHSVISDAVKQSLEPMCSTSKPLFQVESRIEKKMLPVGEAANQLGVTDRTVRRIIAEGHAETERRFVPIEIHDQRSTSNLPTRNVEKVFVSFDDLLSYRENRSLGGRPKKLLDLSKDETISKNRIQ